MFDSVSGKCVTASEAIAVTMDLEARKAVNIDDEQRARFMQLLLTEPG